MNHFEHFIVFFSAVSDCVSISAFASLFDFTIGFRSSAVGLKIRAITAGIEKSIIKKKREKHDKIVLLGKAKLDTVEDLLSMALIHVYISHDEFVSVTNAMRRNKKSKIGKMLWNILDKNVERYCVIYKKNTTNENSSV